tara:strand:+ start:995 stop:2191 length:1197 start_codon:yes stop_codon:yes gene_type:complete
MAILKPTTTVTGIEDPRTAKQRAGFIESAFDLASEPIPIPVQGIADFDPLETEARTLASGLGGFQPFLNTGADMAREGFDTLGLGRGALGTAAGFYAPGAVRSFYNPFEEDVVQQTIKDLTEKSDIAGIGDRFKAVRSGAFGGSRGRLMDVERERALGRGLGEAIGGIRSRGFLTAQQAAQAAGRGITGIGQQFGNLGRFMGGAGQQFANIGTTGLSNLISQINALSSLGSLGRGIQQAREDARFDAAGRAALEPRSRLATLQGMLSLLSPTRSQTQYEAIAGTSPIAQAIGFLQSGGIGNLFNFGRRGNQQPQQTQPAPNTPVPTTGYSFNPPAIKLPPIVAPGTGGLSSVVGQPAQTSGYTFTPPSVSLPSGGLPSVIGQPAQTSGYTFTPPPITP